MWRRRLYKTILLGRAFSQKLENHGLVKAKNSKTRRVLFCGIRLRPIEGDEGTFALCAAKIANSVARDSTIVEAASKESAHSSPQPLFSGETWLKSLTWTV